MAKKKSAKKRMGPASADVKFKILQMRAQKISVEDIAREVERPVHSVEKIVFALKQLAEQAFDPHNPLHEGFYPTEPVRQMAIQQLMSSGVDEVTATRRVTKAVELIDKQEAQIENDDQFIAYCQSPLGSELFVTKKDSKGNNLGVSVYTKAVSERGDELAQTVKPNNNGVVDNKTVFKI